MLVLTDGAMIGRADSNEVGILTRFFPRGEGGGYESRYTVCTMRACVYVCVCVSVCMCSAIGSGRSIKVCERFGLDGARLLYSDRDSCNNKVETGMLRYSELSYQKRDPEQGQGRDDSGL